MQPILIVSYRLRISYLNTKYIYIYRERKNMKLYCWVRRIEFLILIKAELNSFGATSSHGSPPILHLEMLIYQRLCEIVY